MALEPLAVAGRHVDERRSVGFREQRVPARVRAGRPVRSARRRQLPTVVHGQVADDVGRRRRRRDGGYDGGAAGRLVADLGLPAQRRQGRQIQRRVQRDRHHAVRRPGLPRVHDRHHPHAVQHVQVQAGRRRVVVRQKAEETVDPAQQQAVGLGDEQEAEQDRVYRERQVHLIPDAYNCCYRLLGLVLIASPYTHDYVLMSVRFVMRKDLGRKKKKRLQLLYSHTVSVEIVLKRTF